MGSAKSDTQTVANNFKLNPGKIKKKCFRKKYNLMHFERHLAFQNASNYIFPENLKDI